MKVSGIDKDFIEIIDFLNTNGFRPWASCDGVLEHHSQDNIPLNAYISFLKSEKIIELMAALLRDKSNFGIVISNNSHLNPYEYLGNLIEGNIYQVSFNNSHGERTEYFEKIINGIANGKILITDDEKEKMSQISDYLETLNDSELFFSIIINQNYQPFIKKKGKTNILVITSKDGIGYSRNMQECANLISEKYGIELKRRETNENYEDTEEFILAQSNMMELYFQGDDFSRVLEMIKYIKSQEKILGIYVPFGPDYDDYIYE